MKVEKHLPLKFKNKWKKNKNESKEAGKQGRKEDTIVTQFQEGTRARKDKQFSSTASEGINPSIDSKLFAREQSGGLEI